MSSFGSTGRFRRTYGQSPYVLMAAPQAAPLGRGYFVERGSIELVQVAI
jgi:hypothetical protein